MLHDTYVIILETFQSSVACIHWKPPCTCAVAVTLRVQMRPKSCTIPFPASHHRVYRSYFGCSEVPVGFTDCFIRFLLIPCCSACSIQVNCCLTVRLSCCAFTANRDRSFTASKSLPLRRVPSSTRSGALPEVPALSTESATYSSPADLTNKREIYQGRCVTYCSCMHLLSLQ